MTETPADWVLIEAAKRSEYANADDPTWMRKEYRLLSPPFRALCDMIEKHEQPPVDRKLLCAREAMQSFGYYEGDIMLCGVKAIELWIEGYGEGG